MAKSSSYSSSSEEKPKRGAKTQATKQKKKPIQKITDDAPAGKSQRGGHRRKKKKIETFALYIYKVLKQVHPEIGVSRKAMSILNSFVNDCYERITKEAASLVKWQQKRTVSSREIQTSVKLNLPGELAKHAIHEGNRAVQRYINP